MASDDPHEIALHLSAAESLVLFEMLSRWSDEAVPDGLLEDASEGEVLSRLLADLERQLVSPLAADYGERLRSARTAVIGAT